MVSFSVLAFKFSRRRFCEIPARSAGDHVRDDTANYHLRRRTAASRAL
jgi:hypothetical protein